MTLSSEVQWAIQGRLASVAVEERSERIIPGLAKENHAALLEAIDLHLAIALAAANVITSRANRG